MALLRKYTNKSDCFVEWGENQTCYSITEPIGLIREGKFLSNIYQIVTFLERSMSKQSFFMLNMDSIFVVMLSVRDDHLKSDMFGE